MKVKDAIKILEKLDGDMELLKEIEYNGVYYNDVYDIEVVRVDSSGDVYYKEDYDEEEWSEILEDTKLAVGII